MDPILYRDLGNDFSMFDAILKRYSSKVMKLHSIIPYTELHDLNYYGFYILSGYLRLCLQKPDGGQKIAAVIKQNGFLQCYSSTQLSRATEIMMLEPFPEAEVLIFSKDEFEHLVKENGELALHLLVFQENALASMHYDLRESLFSGGLKQVCNLIYDVTKRKGTNKISITQEMISEYIGLDRTNVARYLKFLKEENVVKTSRGVVEVIDFENLDKIIRE